MRNPFTVFRRCRELEAQNEKLNCEIKRMGEKLSEITFRRLLRCKQTTPALSHAEASGA